MAKGVLEPQNLGEWPGDQNTRKREHRATWPLCSCERRGQSPFTTLTSLETGTRFSRDACQVACWAASETAGVGGPRGCYSMRVE